MWRIQGWALALAGLLAVTVPAHATATLTCDADDKAVEFHFQAAVGLAGSFSAIKAELGTKARQSGAARTVVFEAGHLVQRWTTGRDVRLRFLRDDPTLTVDLTIETRGKRDDETERPGTYRLEISGPATSSGPDTTTLKGRATCTLG